MRKYRWGLAAFLLLVATLVLPQLAYFATDSVLALIGGALVPLAVLGWLLVRKALTITRAVVGLLIAAAVAGMVGRWGTDGAQVGLALATGRVLDGVTVAEALAKAQENTWVRLTDVNVRAGEKASVTMVSGGGYAKPGQVARTTSTSYAFAPLTARDKGRGVRVWACADYASSLDRWAAEGRPVQGAMRRIPEWLVAEMPGGVADDPRCIHLDWSPNLASARESAIVVPLTILLMVTLFTLVGVVAAAVAESS